MIPKPKERQGREVKAPAAVVEAQNPSKQWAGKRVVISGIRDLADSSVSDVEEVIRSLLKADPAVVIVGGARGVDTVALRTAAAIAPGKILVVVPGRVRDQPAQARGVIERSGAHGIAEMNLDPRHPGSYHARNRRMLSEADVLLAFTDGRKTGGTGSTIQEALKRGIPVEIHKVHRARKANAR